MKAICLTSDYGNWLLPGFLHQWKKYSPYPITIYGFTNPGLENFVSIGPFREYPKERWSDGVLKVLDRVEDEIILLMLEDYWLMRAVNQRALHIAEAMMRADRSIARFDMTNDRSQAGSGDIYSRLDLGSVEDVDVFESYVVDYRCSYQAALWRVEHLRALLIPGESPWQSELNGCGRMAARPDMRVLGTYQWPVRYQIVVNKGVFDREGRWMRPSRSIYPEDWKELDRHGLTQKSAA